MHQVITYGSPSKCVRPFGDTPSARARSLATDGFSAITSVCVGRAPRALALESSGSSAKSTLLLLLLRGRSAAGLRAGGASGR